MLQDITTDGMNVVYGVWGFFVNVAPHNFGLLLIPLIVLGAISLWAARQPHARG